MTGANLNAALGVAQLEDLDHRLDAKRQLAQRYAEVFIDLEGVELCLAPGCRSNHWLVSLRFTTDDPLSQAARRCERAHSIGLLLRPI